MGKTRHGRVLSHLKRAVATLPQVMGATKAQHLGPVLPYCLIFQEELDNFCVTKSDCSVRNFFFFLSLKIRQRPIKTGPWAPSLLSLQFVLRPRGLFTPTGPYHPLLPRGMRDAGNNHHKEPQSIF